MAEQPDYEPTRSPRWPPSRDRAASSRSAIALEQMLKNGGRGMLYVPFLNYAGGLPGRRSHVIAHPDSVPGLSDGGVHVGMICDGSFPTSMLTHWTRDRTRGPKLPLEDVIRMQTRDTACTVGLYDRGLIAPGFRADLNVIDYESLTLHAPQVVYDLPAGGRRLIQKATGYVATLIAGQVTYRGGEPTGALPGRLVRGSKNAPMALAAE